MKQVTDIRVAGTTFENRQKYLYGLSRSKQTPRITLLREPNNPADPNAIKVMCHTKKCYPIGYIPKKTARRLAPIMDAGSYVYVDAVDISGGNGVNYGMGLTLRFYC